MVAEETRLTFTASIAGVKLVLKVAAPQAPRAPSIPYQWSSVGGGNSTWRPRPEDIKRKPKETDEDYASNPVRLRREAEQASYDDAHTRWEQDMLASRAGALRHRDRLMSYAQLVGVASVFGGQQMTVVLTPADQDMLPGFSANLLAPVEESEPSLIEEEDAGFPDPDGDDEEGEDE
jgi:hypothetical protein